MEVMSSAISYHLSCIPDASSMGHTCAKALGSKEAMTVYEEKPIEKPG